VKGTWEPRPAVSVIEARTDSRELSPAAEIDPKLTPKVEYTQAAGRMPEARTRSSTAPANWAKLTSKRRATSLAVVS
jgi:hypothetical protein